MVKPVNPNLKTLTAYTEHYKEACFQAFYAAGRPNSGGQIQKIVPKDEQGRTPHVNLLNDWRREMLWDVRADELDVRAVALAEDELVSARAMMLKEQAARARELQDGGMEYLREHGFDNSSSAVSAIVKGAAMERTSRGLSESMTKLLQMDDDKLMWEVQRLIAEAEESGEIIDVAPPKDEEVDNA